MIRRLPAPALLFAAALVACDSEGGAPPPTQLTASIYTAPGAADPFQQVTEMRACAVGDDLACKDTQVATPYQPGGGATLPDIPYSKIGAPRQLVVEGWSVGAGGEEVLVSRGRSLDVSVVEGGVLQSLSILFARVNSILALASADTKEPQALAQGRVGHAIAHTSKREVVVAGGGVLTGTGKEWWKPEGFLVEAGPAVEGEPEPLPSYAFLKSVEVVDETDNTAYVPVATEVIDAEGKTRVTSPELFYPRVWATATAISTGQVLVAGGWTTQNGVPAATKKVELYYPLGSKQPQEVKVLAAELAKPRAGHTATVVEDDGQSFWILFVGGDVDGSPTFEVWSPKEGSTGARPLPDADDRRFHAATWFEATDPAAPNAAGTPAVLIVGGEAPAELSGEGEAPPPPLDTYLIYDIGKDNMLAQPSKLPKGGRTQLTATFVPDQGKIYVVGGYTSANRTTVSNAIDVFEANSLTPTFKVEGIQGFNLHEARGGHTATLMTDGAVLVAGGTDGVNALGTIEIIYRYFKSEGDVVKPRITVAFACESGCVVPSLPAPRFGHQAVFLERGVALLVGGAAGGGETSWNLLTDLLLYNPQ